ncbi:MAG: hypothetical protein JWR88_1802 [Pseudonocardia sp.]|nr:hypothetical protein [Pseudonocardia sp.]
MLYPLSYEGVRGDLSCVAVVFRSGRAASGRLLMSSVSRAPCNSVELRTRLQGTQSTWRHQAPKRRLTLGDACADANDTAGKS